MKPLTLDFPHRVTIELPGHVRRALREVADREPHENDEVLLLRVLSRGIVATMAAEMESCSKPLVCPVTRTCLR